MNPSILSDPTVAQLAERLGVSKRWFRTFTSDVTREFGVHNRAQMHGWHCAHQKPPGGPIKQAENRAKLAASTTEQAEARDAE